MPRETVFEGAITSRAKTTAVINIGYIKELIKTAVAAGVNETIDDAEAFARKEVPVRKVFRYGRKNVGSRMFAEARFQGRQETRPQSLEEALGESILRRKLGLPSAFPTTKSGRRIIGTKSMVETTDFGSYRTKHRANLAERRGEDLMETRRRIANIGGQNRIVEEVDLFQVVLDRSSGQSKEVRVGSELRIRSDIESDLSSVGRGELRRAQGTTLGGALRKSIRTELVRPTQSLMKGKVIAGNDEVDYAKYVEFGTRRSRAQPFMRPALAHAREELQPNVMAQLKGIGK